MQDQTILERIHALMDEEQRLYDQKTIDSADQERLDQLQDQLDQCWDLLRRRRARREFGDDPDTAEARSTETVEDYSFKDYKGDPAE